MIQVPENVNILLYKMNSQHSLLHHLRQQLHLAHLSVLIVTLRDQN